MTWGGLRSYYPKPTPIERGTGDTPPAYFPRHDSSRISHAHTHSAPAPLPAKTGVASPIKRNKPPRSIQTYTRPLTHSTAGYDTLPLSRASVRGTRTCTVGCIGPRTHHARTSLHRNHTVLEHLSCLRLSTLRPLTKRCGGDLLPGK